MKLGIIADIHANVYGLSAVLEDMGKVDYIFCNGDIVGYYHFVNEVFELIEKNNINFIQGNHDNALINDLPCNDNYIGNKSLEYTKDLISQENLEKLKKAPLEKTLEFDGIKFKCLHGGPNDILTEYVYPDSDFSKLLNFEEDYVILAHTHIPMIIKNKILNPGSCGQPRDGDPRASYILFDTETQTPQIKRIEYNIDLVYQKTKEYGMQKEMGEMLYHGKILKGDENE